ncbi:phage major capsid protein [Bradyrhizobium sp. MOS002]|uniref:phage major capsid protein n=1 Tax=Bradyrhizobium sp. MOS002 TaxID=2133947 RepID=UPI000D118165|nr:phage major capsid protein [Bradyrhizobium sp. MOS002]PSO30214.1 phage major capsid protein [Bradyrhizobium sp. MOS002]
MFHQHKARMLSGAIELKEGDVDPAALVQKALDDLQKSVDERLKAVEGKGVDPKLQDQIDKLTAKINRPGTGTDEQKEADAVEKKAFETFVRKGKEALSADEIKSLRVSDDTAGGFLAPDAFQAELDRNVVLFSPVRSVARVMPTGAPAVLWPKRTGGMTGAWVGETQARSETTVTFGQNRYGVCEIAAYVDVSNAMLEDSAFDIGQLLAFEFGEEFGYLEGVAFVNGASQLSPSGFMQDANVTYTPGTDASLVKGDGLIDLYHAIKAPYRVNGTWGMNSTTLGAIRKLKDTNGNYMVAMAGLNNTPVTTLLGRPIVEMPDMPDIAGNAYPIIFGDFQQGYRIFDRISLSILRDPYSQATNGMTRFHGRRRVAGGVGKAEAIRKLKIATS